MAESAVEQQRSPSNDAVGEPAARHSLIRRLLDRFPPLPPGPSGRLARIAPYIVVLLMVAFVAYYSTYLFSLHDAFQTNGEDLGIMDQALWNTLHGAVMHQTICNIVSDTNCLGDVSRFAIHFEPLMLVISLLYVVAPSPKTLVFFQALVVSVGALPAYWIASRRLQSALAGIGFAIVFLLYPGLTSAVTFDFHAVTLSAAFLMFALYFMLTRNNVGLFISCLLAIATKEEVPLDIAMIGLVILVFQRRWRVGAALVGLSIAWVGLYLVVVHFASPLGYSSTASRYAYLGHGPVQIVGYVLTHPISVIRQHVLDPLGIYYYRTLFSGSGYLALLSPWVWVMALPVILLNTLSSDVTMHLGIYQYNAEIVPALVLASIESVAWLVGGTAWLTRRIVPVVERSPLAGLVAQAQEVMGHVTARASQMLARMSPRGHLVRIPAASSAANSGAAQRPILRWLRPSRIVLALLMLLALSFSIHEQQTHGNSPLSRTFVWPVVTAHDRLADDIIKLIPPSASVCAQATLIPHVSERRFIYQFPYDDLSSDYIFLDVTAFRYPLVGSPDVYFSAVDQVLASGHYHVVAARDGLLLLARNSGSALTPIDPLTLPASFFTFAQVPADQPIGHPEQAQFGPSLQFLGYSVQPNRQLYNNDYLYLTTYWRTSAPLSPGTMPVVLNQRPGAGLRTFDRFFATEWLPMSKWQPGQIYAVQLDMIPLNGQDVGIERFSVHVIDGATQTALPVTGPSGAVLTNGTDLLFATFSVG
jgi:uncharacterized membrane protein